MALVILCMGLMDMVLMTRGREKVLQVIIEGCIVYILVPKNGETDVSINADQIWTGIYTGLGDTVMCDVYFDITYLLQKITYNQSSAFYSLNIIDYETTYYWIIKAWDNHYIFTEGPIWSFTTETESVSISNLDYHRDLRWNGIEPSVMVPGTITVENIGDTIKNDDVMRFIYRRYIGGK